MRKIFLGMICLVMLAACKNEQEKTTEPAIAGESTAKTPPPVEFADQKYVDMGKKDLQLFASGDIEGWLNRFADNAVYRWSAGDSLAGKEAIAKYWRERRTKVIDSLQFSNEIWLPVNVNQPQSIERKGTWLLSWYQVNARYKNGQKLSFWVHSDMHYNSNNQIDELIQYIDRAPINAAVSKK